MGGAGRAPHRQPTPCRYPPPPPAARASAALLARPAGPWSRSTSTARSPTSSPTPSRPARTPSAVPALAALAPAGASVAVVTGRPADVAVRYGGFAGVPGLDHLVVLGHYGAERWDAVHRHRPRPRPAPRASPPSAPNCPASWTRSAPGSGTWIEEKGRARRRPHPPRRGPPGRLRRRCAARSPSSPPATA